MSTVKEASMHGYTRCASQLSRAFGGLKYIHIRKKEVVTTRMPQHCVDLC